MSYNIAIDGPAGAGKSTIAKKIAKNLGFIYVDTGAMYRAMAYYLLSKEVDENSTERISSVCKEADISIIYENGEQQVLLNGQNITGHLREEKVGNMASVCAANGDVRVRLVELQRKLAASSNVVMDGRDIGTCVLPAAQLKIYLTAGVETRAKRRYLELQEKNITCDIKEIERDIADRDYRDMNREISPLKQAEDAVVVDSSHMTIEQVVERILSLYRETEEKA